MEKCTGAGIILYVDNRGISEISNPDYDKDILYFFLEREDGQLDFPKGGIDKGENSPLDCAIRETREESNLKPLDYDLLEPETNFLECGEGLILFLGKLHMHSMKHAEVLRNEKTLEFEHKEDGCRYLTKLEGEKNLLDYLQIGLNWADKIIQR